jgi:hypothetical protein
LCASSGTEKEKYKNFRIFSYWTRERGGAKYAAEIIILGTTVLYNTEVKGINSE